MADTHETIADLIAWLRRPREGENAYLTLWRDEIADRFDAAHKRERGDAAKLREALVEALEHVNNVYDILSRSCIEIEKARQGCREARGVLIPTLAAPPRNCDRFATVDEARKAHEEYRMDYIRRASNKFDFPMEFEAWLFAPATEQEGGAE